MKRDIVMRSAVTLIGLGCAAGVAAQDAGQRMPPASSDPASCQQVDWHEELRDEFPNIVEACQETVVVDGKTWARFSAAFQQVDTDGNVRFMLHDRLDTELGDVTIDPAPGQVAYINERRTEFEDLDHGQEVSLYVPEGYYGFASLPGAPMDQVAAVADDDSSMIAQADTDSQSRRGRAPRDADPVIAQLPETAGPLPWFALGGVLSLLAGLGIGLGRRVRG